MCAINPKHGLDFTISVYTSLDMDAGEFLDLVITKILETEQVLNATGKLRWHVRNYDKAAEAPSCQ